MDRTLDFLIIGAQKAGTTSLWHALRQHSDIFLSPAKEIHFWTNNEFWCQGPAYLAPFYEDLGSERLVGGSYAHMMYFPNAPSRVALYNRKIKVIACLRDPVTRAYSAYWFARLNGLESESTFENALEREAHRVFSTGKDFTELTYLSHGYYAEQLERWINTLGREQVLVVDSARLRSNTEEVVQDITSWLGVSPEHTDTDLIHANKAAVARIPVLQALIMRDYRAKRLFRQATTPRMRWEIQKLVTEPLARWNQRTQQYPSISKDMRAQLIEHFEPHTQKLEVLLDRSFSHWRDEVSH